MFRTESLYKKIHGFYPERKEKSESPFDEFIRGITERVFNRLRIRTGKQYKIADSVNRIGVQYQSMDQNLLKEETARLKKEMRTQGVTDERICRTFALVREMANRHLGMRHYDVQLIGGWALFKGMVAEMETGEGKTLTATLPACTAALVGMPTHIITVNDYLASRDANLMRPLYEAMSLSVGVIQNGMTLEERQKAYQNDIVYCTNKEIVFDYLKDHLTLRHRPGHVAYRLQPLYGNNPALEKLILRGLYFAIVDEADSVLIDEARTPLIISGVGDNNFEEEVYRQALAFAEKLIVNQDYKIEVNNKKVLLKNPGKEKLEKMVTHAGGFWQARRKREMLARQALTALYLFHKDKDYLIKEGKVTIVDEYTGRLMSDRSWERGLHQMIECKEGCEITVQKDTLARITYQRFFRRYHFLAGMTGTASEVARELWSVYKLQVLPVPTNKTLKRQENASKYFATEKEKLESIVKKTKELKSLSRPILIGTPSVEVSEKLSSLLTNEDLPHRILNARQDKEEADIIAMAGHLGQITVATNMAGRGTDIKLEKGVEKLGGLYVIASERHNARRIDRQLSGRCGRQGDPGTYQVFVSFEDELFKPYESSLAVVIGKLLLKKLRPTGRIFCTIFTLYTQKKVEKKHFHMRRNLLKHDTSMENHLAFSGKGE